MTEPFEIIQLDWLTKALRCAGYLHSGKIVGARLQQHALTPFLPPRIAFLEMHYSPDTKDPGPPRLVFKYANGVKELFFYDDIAPQMISCPAATCYYSEYDSQAERSYFLLEDLSATHRQTDWPIPPSNQLCFDTISCLASLHAFWWRKPGLDDEFSQKLAMGNNWHSRIGLAIDNIGIFMGFMSDRLTDQRRDIYECVLTSPNQAWKPQRGGRNQTLLHGDAHFWNFLYPENPHGEHIRMIDWNSWDIGRPTDDLAYMIGLHWYPDRRKILEKALLHHYHQHLVDAGIDYGWDQCWNDYRLSVILNLFIPVWQWQRGISPIVWWSHLERAFLAFDDLQCAELL